MISFVQLGVKGHSRNGGPVVPVITEERVPGKSHLSVGKRWKARNG